VVAVVAMAGCYRPSDPDCVIACTQSAANACPSGLVCGNANLCEPATGPSCNGLLDAMNDSAGDGAIDAANPACNQSAFTSVVQLISALDYTANADRTRFSVIMGGEIKVNEYVVDSTAPTDYIYASYGPPGNTGVFSAHIDPTGDLVYLTADVGTMGTRVYLIRYKGLETWSTQHDLVSLVAGGTEAVLADGARIGSSTAPTHGARRFPVETTLGFDEYSGATLSADTSFLRSASFTKGQLGVTLLRDPSYTSDGLRVVFVGQVDLQVGIYMAERATIGGGFGTAQLLRLGNANDRSPHLTADCGHLYWTNNGIVAHAVAPM
jgi:hypothetical protein